jgi:mRNA interferase MazF
MRKFDLGDIVLLKFPFTNSQTFKKRPALILNDFNDHDILVCRIISQTYTTSFDVDINNWKESGLKLPSVIRVHKLATLEKDMVESVLGKIDDSLKEKVKIVFSNLVG